MRTITRIEAPKEKEKPKPLVVCDLSEGTFFRLANTDIEGGGWLIRTADRSPSAVSLKGRLLHILNSEVSEVLAHGDSLNIGPEVQDGSAKNA